jgi:hypothetical protein
LSGLRDFLKGCLFGPSVLAHRALAIVRVACTARRSGAEPTCMASGAACMPPPKLTAVAGSASGAAAAASALGAKRLLAAGARPDGHAAGMAAGALRETVAAGAAMLKGAVKGTATGTGGTPPQWAAAAAPLCAGGACIPLLLLAMSPCWVLQASLPAAGKLNCGSSCCGCEQYQAAVAGMPPGRDTLLCTASPMPH